MSEDGTPKESLIGTVLEGAYRIVGLVGEGGMGAVYEGLHLRLHKRIAVKVMARELAANADALSRFEKTAPVPPTKVAPASPSPATPTPATAPTPQPKARRRLINDL